MEIKLPSAVGWKPRLYQIPVWQHFFPKSEKKRAVVIGHRRWGKDLLAVNLCGCKSQERIGTYWHVLPTYKQGRNIVWNGIDGNGRPFLSYLHPSLVRDMHTNDMRVHFHNGSVFQVVGSDDIDRLVGTNPVGVVLSEFSLHDPKVLDYLRPILRENKGWLLIITTIRGKNHGYRMKRTAMKRMLEDSNWLHLDQTVLDTHTDDGERVVTEKDIESDRLEGMSEQLIRQEYYNDPEAPMQGAYYSAEMAKASTEGRIGTVLYDPKLPVDTHWDLGVGDATAIVFTQTHRMEIRVIDSYENSGEGLAHYAKHIKHKEYHYGKHYAPWDIMVREFTSGKSRFEVAKEMGIPFRVTQKHSVEDGIEQVRNVLGRCWFNDGKCERLIEALRSYRKEEAAVKLGYTGAEGNSPLYKDGPLHDWTSHFADAFRVMAWNVKKASMDDEPMPLPDRTTDDHYQWV